MLKWLKADLHIHTVLSPCGELLMGPLNIIRRALEIGLDIIAITDHNASENVPAALEAAIRTDLTVIPGMEISSREEAHFIGLFPNLEHLNAVQKIIYEHLPAGKNDVDFFGPQYIVNQKNEVVGENTRLLILATSLSSKQVVALVKQHEGVLFPAHVDRKGYSLLNQLGFIPPDLALPVLEISWNGSLEKLYEKFPETKNYRFVCASDAHETSQIGRGLTHFYIEAPSFEEIKKAILNEEGRQIKIQQNISY